MKYLFFLFLISINSFVYSITTIPQPLQNAAQAIYAFPEAKQLLDAAQAQGNIELAWTPFNNPCFAAWNYRDRVILFNSQKSWTEGKKISSFLFELHNVLANADLAYLDRMAESGQINLHAYVEAVERREHQNVFQTSKLIERGIAQGYFPREAYYPVVQDFNTHFKMQLETGHSKLLASKYQKLRAHIN